MTKKQTQEEPKTVEQPAVPDEPAAIEPASVEPAQEAMLDVRDWGQSQVDTYGYETVAAFLGERGSLTGRRSELEQGIREFSQRPV